MGVPGLWDVLRPTGEVRALVHLAVEDGFASNAHGHRAYRIGIDASIWFFHALGGREGENPELRTLFFRCARLLAMPYLPIFVFDGPGRPKIKRGKTVGGKEHWLVNSLRAVLDAFGFECRTAPGEAEAELAFLNRVGVIDAVLSDDVDCFIFGAQTVMRNGSVTLSGNRANATGDAQHIYVYRAEDIAAHPAVGLSRGGLILIALLRGGDYDGTGIVGCGVSTAHALARAGFGDTLLATARRGQAALAAFLPTWRAGLREELRTNASGHAPRKSPSVAKHITDDFPSLEVLRCYTHPLTSERAAGDLGAHGLGELWTNRADVGKIAHVCERFFEWGFEEAVVKRFRTVIWPGAVLRTLLQSALERDKRASLPPGGGPETPSKVLARSLGGMALKASQEHEEDDTDSSDTSAHEHSNRIDVASLIKTIHSTRRHASTDHMLEYRVEVRPRALVARTRAGMQGLRVVNQDSAKDPGADYEDDDDGQDGKIGAHAPDPDSTLRLWMPAPVVEYVCPRLVKEFEAGKTKREAKKRAKGQGKLRKSNDVLTRDEESDDISPVKPKPKTSAKAKPKQSKASQEESDHATVKKMATKSQAMKARQTKERSEEEESEQLLFSKMEAFRQFLRDRHSSKSLVELSDEDPFPASVGPSSDFPPFAKAKKCSKTFRQQGKIQPLVGLSDEDTPPMSTGHFSFHQDRPGPSNAPPRLKPRRFPMSLDDSDTDLFFSGRPAHERTHSALTSSSSSSTSTRFKKSPRKSTEHTSPRKPAAHKLTPPRALSPSPLQPLQRARMKPLQIARSASSRTQDDVIVISSDSDSPTISMKARPQTQKSSAGRRGGSLSRWHGLNLHRHQDVIDLT